MSRVLTGFLGGAVTEWLAVPPTDTVPPELKGKEEEQYLSAKGQMRFLCSGSFLPDEGSSSTLTFPASLCPSLVPLLERKHNLFCSTIWGEGPGLGPCLGGSRLPICIPCARSTVCALQGRPHVGRPVGLRFCL